MSWGWTSNEECIFSGFKWNALFFSLTGFQYPGHSQQI